MKRFFVGSINRIGLLLCGSLLMPAASASEAAIEETREAFTACQQAGLATIDDGVSDAKVVALALTEHCEDEYTALTRAIARHNIDNSNERRMFTIDQNAKTIKTEVSLPLVLENRQKIQ